MILSKNDGGLSNFKSSIVLIRKAPLVRMLKRSRSLIFQKGMTIIPKMVSLKLYADNKKHDARYSVLTCLTVFVQTLNNLYSYVKIECVSTNTLSYVEASSCQCTGARPAQKMMTRRKQTVSKKDCNFVSILREYKNKVCFIFVPSLQGHLLCLLL